ncbi:hypothetical protein BFJ71_g2043 [Fusarium oxysporum]|nr:hypothetical protein BFJ71_g2043 [Fusarium oxysporum]
MDPSILLLNLEWIVHYPAPLCPEYLRWPPPYGNVPPEYPEKALADNHPVASAFLVKTLDLMS